MSVISSVFENLFIFFSVFGFLIFALVWDHWAGEKIIWSRSKIAHEMQAKSTYRETP